MVQDLWRRILSTGWQKQISTGRLEAEKASRELTSSDVKGSRVLARELKAAHGKLKAIHFKSHHPNFEIDFDFSDGKRICSGASTGDIVGTLAFGYFAGGPNRLQIFLDEMGLSISVDEIEKIKPGTTMEVDGKSLRLANGRREQTTKERVRGQQTTHVEASARRKFCVKCKKSDFGIVVPTSVQRNRLQAGLCPYCEGRLIDL